MHALFYFFAPAEWLQRFVYLVLQIVYLSIVYVLIKKENSDFKEHGFWWPENSGKYVSACVLFVLAHIFINLFLLGSFFGFELSAPVPQPFLELLDALLTSVASESVFRGYIQRKLVKVYGFLPVLGVSSLMFSLYGIQIPSVLSSGPTFLFTGIASLFITGVFLGLLFQKTMTLICPVTFYGLLLLLRSLTPLQAAITGYVALFYNVIAYAFLILLVYALAIGKFWEP